jgi:SanA protein
MFNMTARGALQYGSIIVLSIGVVVVLVPLTMRTLTRSSIVDLPERAPRVQAALVLGASVSRGKPSPVLEERAHTAVALYMMGNVSKILVSGDSSNLSHDEVTPVRKYLLDSGVAAEDIFLDHAGFDTYSSMYRARKVFRAESVIIVTQDFHLPRAVFVAQQLGLEAYGIVPERGQGDAYDYMREIPASVKALYDLALGRVPKYLGEPFPLSGSGEGTWY